MFQLARRPGGLLVWPLAALPLLVVTLVGCGQSGEPVSSQTTRYEAAEEPSAEARSGSRAPIGRQPMGEASGRAVDQLQQPPARAAAHFEQFTVPQTSDVQELLAYVNQLGEWQPQPGMSQPEIAETVTRLHQARIEAIDRVMDSGEAAEDADLYRETAEAKLDSLHMLARVDAPGVQEQVRSFCHKLRNSGDAYLARLGRVVMFGLLVGDTANEDGDFQPVLTELRAMLQEEEPTEDVFVAAQQAVVMMQVVGRAEMAYDAMELVGDRFQDSQDPRVAEHANSLLVQAKLSRLDFQTKIVEAMQDQPGAVDALVESVQKVLTELAPTTTSLDLASVVAQNLEYTRQYDAARQVYSMIQQAFDPQADSELAERAARAVELGNRRMGLIGQPFEIEAQTLDGSTFDWSQYRGKVVLVDFWATWCKPCLDELPHIKEAHRKFQDSGFEVVGINLDENPQDLERFLDQQDLPWKTVVSHGEPGEQWFEKPMAVRCGVDGIPFMVLVNQQGIVEALHVRGPLLEHELTKLLGPAPADPAGVSAAPRNLR